VVEVHEEEAEVRLGDGDDAGVSGGGVGDHLLLEEGVEVAGVEEAGAVVGDAEVVDELDVAGVFEGDGGVVAEDAEEGEGGLGKEVELAVVELEDAEDAGAVADGKAGDGLEVELGMLAGVTGPVGVGADVGDDEGIAGGGDVACDAFAGAETEALDGVCVEFGGEGEVELHGLFVDHEEGPVLGAEEVFELMHDGAEEGVEFEIGGEGARYFVEDPQGLDGAPVKCRERTALMGAAACREKSFHVFRSRIDPDPA
jgi:hypothetical protein